jgi:DMSO/TMAO reductase YedYZ heme-binding membrane subunit
MIEYIVTGAVLLVMMFVAYMSSHIVSEKKAGKTIPLPWEKN